jgi:small subunit ribosomal protein S15
MENAVKKFKMHDKDVGSTALQIISFTKKILTLAEHINREKKDKHCRRGIERMVSRRKKMLSYLKRTNFEGYQGLIKELGLRG